MQAFQVFLLSAAISAGIIFFFLRSRVASLALDHVNRPQTMHSEAVPRIGGIAMSLAMFAALILYVENVADDLALVAIFLGSICVVVVSAIDDFRSLSPATRLSIHTLLGSLVVWLILGTSHPQTWPFVVAACFATLSIVWSMNAYNFMDGANGMAGFMGVIGFGAMAIAAAFANVPQLAVICATVSGAVLGFLLLNYPNARVFMGDSGSVLLGFLAATLGWYGWTVGAWALYFPVLVFSPFLMDATVTLLRRAFRGEKIWLPHRQHVYQRLIIDCGWSHRRTAIVYATVMLLAAGDALRWHFGKPLTDSAYRWLPPLSMLLTWVLTYAVLIVVAERKIRQQHRTKITNMSTKKDQGAR